MIKMSNISNKIVIKDRNKGISRHYLAKAL